MRTLRMNLKFALRTLFKTPILTISAIVSIALGIGANTAIFSIFDEVLLRRLPVQEPDRLVNLAAPGPHLWGLLVNIAGNGDEVFSYPMFRDLEKSQTVFTGIAAHSLVDVNVAARGLTLKRPLDCSFRGATFQHSASTLHWDGCWALRMTPSSESLMLWF